MGEIKDDHEQQKQWAARRESGRRRKADMECHSCNQKGHFVREEERQLVEDMLAIGIIQESNSATRMERRGFASTTDDSIKSRR